jgi:uncharacterized protein YbbC (DUF1343 family)
MRTTFGIDRLLAKPGKYLKGKRFALFVNQSSVASNGRYLFEALSAQGYRPEKIFAPEHGLFGTEQDQVTVAEEVDAFTGLKAISLYGQTKGELKPRSADLAGLDALVVDIQDIGCRYYTYAYTMAFCIEACAAHGIEVIVCDRPNPLGGIVVEGNVVQPGFESFVGAYPLTVRHALTLGELARSRPSAHRSSIPQNTLQPSMRRSSPVCIFARSTSSQPSTSSKMKSAESVCACCGFPQL